MFGHSLHDIGGQTENKLLMIDPLGDSLAAYDLSTNIFTPKVSGLSIPTHVGHLSCLASDHGALYIVGGGPRSSTLSTVQILNLHDGEWSMGPEMKQNRNRHSCIVDESNGILLLRCSMSETETLCIFIPKAN